MKSCIPSSVVALALAVPCAAQDLNPDIEGLDTRESYAPYPAPDSGYVTDLANLLPPGQEEEIEQWLWTVESMTGVEIAVVTIASIQDYPQTDNRSIERFATGLFDAWGIGNMPDNDGVLLLVAVSDRKARIELGGGYGNIRDGDAMKIMDRKIIPQFKKGNFAEGVTSGVEAVMREFANVRVGVNWPVIIMVALVPVLILITISLFRNGKRGWGWVCVGLLIVLLLALFRTFRTSIRHAASGASSGWASGGFGGGFGGGFSGGGGASGSW